VNQDHLAAPSDGEREADPIYTAILHLSRAKFASYSDSYDSAYADGHRDARHAAAELVLAASAARSAEIQQLREAQSAVALDIAKWFINGDRPDEWKLREWVIHLDGDAIDKAYDERKEPQK
jgi:hypothetical protein